MSQLLRHLRVFAFYALVLTGTLLSIISIVVVLELREVAVPPELSHEQLLATMTSSQQTSDARTSAPAMFQLDSADLAAARADQSPRGRILVEHYPVQNRLVEQWQAHRNALIAQTQEAAEAAALLYAAEAKRPGERDRLLRFVEIKNWHHDQTRKADGYLDEQRASLAGVNAALLALRVVPDSMVPAAVLELDKRVRAAETLLAETHSFAPLQARKDVPLVESWYEWHPFAALSGWLRTQQSLELASIIGMLGFGLLGAAASTVVRSPRNRKRKLRIGDNLISLVVSGTTAAFATYLALKGSLAIVSTDGAEPNPYVLLLTCFVAAVYWEEAWERVRNAVRRDQRDDDDDDAEAEDSASDRQSGDQAGARRKVQAPPMASVTPDEAKPDPKDEPAPAPQPA